MEIHEIQKLPVKDLLSENGLVALWCTNKAAFRSFALQKFFECWNVELVATWYWIKVFGCFSIALRKLRPALVCCPLP